MKVYQKPQMLTLSLSANDMLCSGCAIGTRGTTNDTLLFLDSLYGNGDGFLTEAEAASVGLFGSSENCSIAVEGYCKFTAVDSGFGSVFTS